MKEPPEPPGSGRAYIVQALATQVRLEVAELVARRAECPPPMEGVDAYFRCRMRSASPLLPANLPPSFARRRPAIAPLLSSRVSDEYA